MIEADNLKIRQDWVIVEHTYNLQLITHNSPLSSPTLLLNLYFYLPKKFTWSGLLRQLQDYLKVLAR